MNELPDMERIRKLRLLLGFTQQHMADSFGISVRTIENWEGGKSAPPEWVAALLIEKMEGMLRSKTTAGLPQKSDEKTR